jgi:hypothetical protein
MKMVKTKEDQGWLAGLVILIVLCFFIYFAFLMGVSRFKNDVIGKAVEGACSEDWICGDYSTCEDGIQVRSCVDRNYCLTDLKKPEERIECYENGFRTSGMSIRADFEQRTGITFGGVILFGLFILVLSSLAATLIAKEISSRSLEREKNNEIINNLTITRLANYIQREINCGYTRHQIAQKLTQEGWNKKSIDDAFSKVKILKKEDVLLENRWKMDLSKKIDEEFKSMRG